MIPIVLLALAAVGYWAAAVGFQIHLLRRNNREWQRWTQLVLGSHAVHTLGLIALGVQLRHFPLASMHEAIATLAWLLVALNALLGQRWKVEALGSVAAPAAAVLTTFSAFALHQVEPVPPRGAWFILHAGFLTLSYAAFSLAAGSAGLYFVQARRLKSKKLSSAFQLPSLDTLDRVAFRMILVGFPMLLLGMGSGMLITSWRWNWDATEALVAFTGAAYMGYLYARMVAGWQGRRVNMLLLAAYVCVLVSLLVPGQFHQL